MADTERDFILIDKGVNMMTEGNFGFIYSINRNLYNKLYSAEMYSRIDFNRCGQDCRSALEIFINTIIKKKGLVNQLEGLELFRKVEKLRSESFLREEGFLNQGERIEEKCILPSLGKVKYEREDKKKTQMDYWDYMRRYGNRGSHVSVKPSDPRQTYSNSVKCLKGFFKALKIIYKNQIPSDTGDFDENKMPIGEYCVYSSHVPSDSVRSKCEREFLAYTKDENGDKNFYAILRLYNKQDADDVFMLRNQKCFSEAAKMSLSSVPEGMTRLREIIPKDSSNSSFYIISYIFNQKPSPLNNEILSTMDLNQRVRFCGRIVNCLENLHTSPIPIYHRMLNYECIYACKIRSEWIPYIIKFDYAKIVSKAPIGTVYANAVKAKGKLNERSLNKYLPPEWDSITQDAGDKEWSKVDIYSLGILCSDILVGKIENQVVSLDKLEELGVSDELLDTLDIMRADDPNERWGIEDIKGIFDEEYRRGRK